MSGPLPDPAFVVGAYAAMPADPVEQDAFYRSLSEQLWIDGLELPFPGDIQSRPGWLAGRLAPTWQTNTITAIPGTMERLRRNPVFGLASPDPAGRAEALAYAQEIRHGMLRLADALGRNAIKYVQLHSAPTRIDQPDRLLASLGQLLEWDWAGAEVVIEHCDRYFPGQVPEKGFLPLEDEIEVARQAGIGIHLNWGRSCIETRDPAAPARAIAATRARGRLSGVVFSGASPSRSAYGPAWADAHLPATPDEPSSLLGIRRIAECSRIAMEPAVPGKPAAYLGAKICVPPESTLNERVVMIRTIHDVTVSPLRSSA